MQETLAPSNIVTMDKLPEIQQHLVKLKEAINEHKLAHEAGIGNPAQLKQLQDMHDKMLAIKRVYFPGH